MSGRGKGGRKVVGKKTNQSARAGLMFPVARFKRHLKHMRIADRIGKSAPVYLSSVLEYLCAEILELAGNASRDNHKKRITPRHILLAIRNDEELNKLLQHVNIASGGVMPYIHTSLVKGKTDKLNIDDTPPVSTPTKRKAPTAKKPELVATAKDKPMIIKPVRASSNLMALERGDSFVLEGSLGKISMGLGWDTKIDVDASVMIFDKAGTQLEVVFYGHLTSTKYDIKHSGDHLSGGQAKRGEDEETVTVNLKTLPDEVTTLLFVVNVFSSGKTFKDVSSAYVRLVDSTTGEERCRFTLTEEHIGTKNALIMCKVFRSFGTSAWRLMTIGEPATGSKYTELTGQVTKYITEDYVPEGAKIQKLTE
jgi:histone H2A